MSKVITDRRPVTDQVVGKSQAAGRRPSTEGIASQRIAPKRTTAAAMNIANAVKRGIDCADTLLTLVNARDSADPTHQAIAARLLENKEFIKAMIAATESILRDVKAAAASVPKADSEPAATTSEQVGPDHPESELEAPNNRSQVPGTYTKDQLLEDLATQNNAIETLARRDGMDAARARVRANPLIPPWDSPAWAADAREEFKARALLDGFAALHISKAGDGIGMRGTTADDDTEKAMRRLGAAPLEAHTPHPRSFDR